MNTITKKLGALVAAGFLMGGLAQAAILDVTFGSNNDVLGGFSVIDPNPTSVTTETDSVRWTQTQNSLQNAGLLQSVSLNRGVGAAYTIRGNTTWSAEYDRTYRQGIYLFGDDINLSNDVEPGALSIQFQVDNSGISIREALNTANYFGPGQIDLDGTSPYNDDGLNSNDTFTDVQMNFVAEIEFLAGDQLQVDFTFEHDFPGSVAGLQTDSISATLTASDFTGDLFGFAARSRNDGGADSVINWQSFSITQTAIPEPSTLVLLGLALGSVFLFRRRK
jgi:hypothetical protein